MTAPTSSAFMLVCNRTGPNFSVSSPMRISACSMRRKTCAEFSGDSTDPRTLSSSSACAAMLPTNGAECAGGEPPSLLEVGDVRRVALATRLWVPGTDGAELSSSGGGSSLALASCESPSKPPTRDEMSGFAGSASSCSGFFSPPIGFRKVRPTVLPPVLARSGDAFSAGPWSVDIVAAKLVNGASLFPRTTFVSRLLPVSLLRVASVAASGFGRSFPTDCLLLSGEKEEGPVTLSCGEHGLSCAAGPLRCNCCSATSVFVSSPLAVETEPAAASLVVSSSAAVCSLAKAPTRCSICTAPFDCSAGFTAIGESLASSTRETASAS